jgi:hypothetical protein
MNVVHLLHEHSFTENGKNVLFRLPEGISIVPFPLLMQVNQDISFPSGNRSLYVR